MQDIIEWKFQISSADVMGSVRIEHGIGSEGGGILCH